MGGCVSLKTAVTEMRRSSVHYAFIAESVYLAMNSLWNYFLHTLCTSSLADPVSLLLAI